MTTKTFEATAGRDKRQTITTSTTTDSPQQQHHQQQQQQLDHRQHREQPILG